MTTNTELAITTPTVIAKAKPPEKSEAEQAFELVQRQARALASSTLVPNEYRGDRNLGNVIVAINLAKRIGCDPFMVMQNVDIIHGRPGMRAKFLIACVNATKRFTPIRFRWEGEPMKGCPGSSCRAVAKDREDGEECVGPAITWMMAQKEGWVSKKGSKWQTMPELMFCYRAAAFWQRLYAPELSMGIQTREEVEDMTPAGYGEVVVDDRGSSGLARKLGELPEAIGPVVEADVHDSEPQPEPYDAPDLPLPVDEPVDVAYDPNTGEVL